MNDEFYIGWEPKAPPGIGKAACSVVLIMLLFAILAPAALAISQRLIGCSVFEWGTEKTFTGILRVEPYPHLLVPRPGHAHGGEPYSSYHLVAQWKFGLNRERITGLDGKVVTLKGTLIYRGNQTMIETRPEWIQAKGEPANVAHPTIVSLGRQTLVGEIVDSKCFLGVMNPGQRTPHRACCPCRS